MKFAEIHFRLSHMACPESVLPSPRIQKLIRKQALNLELSRLLGGKLLSKQLCLSTLECCLQRMVSSLLQSNNNKNSVVLAQKQT
jgi:hypothetical protein